MSLGEHMYCGHRSLREAIEAIGLCYAVVWCTAGTVPYMLYRGGPMLFSTTDLPT